MSAPTYHLDTSTVVHFLRARAPEVREKIRATTADRIAISQVIRTELLVECLKSRRPAHHREQVDRLLSNIEVVDFDASCAAHYAEIRVDLEAAGTPIGPNDLFIAAPARVHGAILVTTDEAEFRRVPGLSVENWS